MTYFLPIARPALLRLFLLLLTLLLAGPGRGWAQAPAFSQAVSFNPSGGSGSSEGHATATDGAGNQYITGTFDGTLIFGTTTLVSAGGSDIFVVKRSTSTGAWLWAVQAGGTYQEGYGIAVDGSGNALITGRFGGTANFATSPSPTSLVSAGLSDVFVAKFGASTGACMWAVRAGGSDYDHSTCLAVDAGGNALVTGYFQGMSEFATNPVSTILAATGAEDVFVAKFGASTGVCVWAVQAGGSSFDVGQGIAVDASGNALVTGSFWSVASFATSPAPTTLAATGIVDVFVAKFGASTGVCIWAVRAGSSHEAAGYGVAVDASGNALVTGFFDGTASFGTSPAPTTLISAGSFDIFVAKFGANTGTCAWAVRAGGGSLDYGAKVAVDAGGNALVTGSFDGTASFGTSPAPTTLVSAGNSDIFVAKFGGGTGTCAWAVRAGGSGADKGFGVAGGTDGSILITGGFISTSSFGSLALVGGTNVITGYVAVLGGTGTLAAATPAALLAFTLFPNPARNACQVQGIAAGAAVTVCNALGRSLARVLADANGTARLVLPAGLVPGLYLVRCGGQVCRLAVE